MNGIIEFFQSDLGKIVIVAITAIFFGKNPQIIDYILEFLKIQKPKAETNAQLVFPDTPKISEQTTKPDRDDAFVAANVLTDYYTDIPECKEGLEAAKKAGQCLFH